MVVLLDKFVHIANIHVRSFARWLADSHAHTHIHTHKTLDSKETHLLKFAGDRTSTRLLSVFSMVVRIGMNLFEYQKWSQSIKKKSTKELSNQTKIEFSLCCFGCAVAVADAFAVQNVTFGLFLFGQNH